MFVFSWGAVTNEKLPFGLCGNFPESVPFYLESDPEHFWKRFPEKFPGKLNGKHPGKVPGTSLRNVFGLTGAVPGNVFQ